MPAREFENFVAALSVVPPDTCYHLRPPGTNSSGREKPTASAGKTFRKDGRDARKFPGKPIDSPTTSFREPSPTGTAFSIQGQPASRLSM